MLNVRLLLIGCNCLLFFQVHESLQRIRERKLVNFIEWGPASIQVFLIDIAICFGMQSLFYFNSGFDLSFLIWASLSRLLSLESLHMFKLPIG